MKIQELLKNNGTVRHPNVEPQILLILIAKIVEDLKIYILFLFYFEEAKKKHLLDKKAHFVPNLTKIWLF